MEHSGLIANRPNKGEDSFFVTSKKPCPALTTENDYRDDANESDNRIATKSRVGSKRGTHPYVEFEALQRTASNYSVPCRLSMEILMLLKAMKLRN